MPFLCCYIIDKFGAKRVLLLVQMLIFLGQLTIFLSPHFVNYSSLFLGRFLYGLGSESLSVINIATETNWFSEKELSFAMSLDTSFPNVVYFANGAIQPLIYTQSQSLTTTLMVGVLVGLVSLGASIAVYRFEGTREQQGATIDPADEAQSHIKLGDIMLLPREYWLLCFAMVSGALAPRLFSNMASEFYQQKYKFSLQVADFVIGFEFLVLACAIPLVGYWVDRHPNRLPLVLTSCAGYAIAFGFISYLGSTLGEVIAMVLIVGVSDAVYISVMWPCGAKQDGGTAFGLISTTVNLLYVVGPVGIGYIIDMNTDKSTNNKIPGFNILGVI